MQGSLPPNNLGRKARVPHFHVLHNLMLAFLATAAGLEPTTTGVKFLYATNYITPLYKECTGSNRYLGRTHAPPV